MSLGLGQRGDFWLNKEKNNIKILDDSPMPSRTSALIAPARLTKFASLFILLATCSASNAGEGGFIGVYGGSVYSGDADSTSNSFKILTGAHVTSNLSLELGYLNMGTTSYDDPTAINQAATSRSNISFSDADHGSVSFGPLGEPTPVDPGQDLYENKGSSTFTGMSEFEPQGAIVSLGYSYPLINKTLSIFAKAGFYAWWADYETVEITASQDNVIRAIEDEGETSAVNTITGGGLIYTPISQLSFRAEIETTQISSGVMPKTRLQNISIGANWEF
jgi:hypothetical protein